jgi:hypothetical protein
LISFKAINAVIGFVSEATFQIVFFGAFFPFSNSPKTLICLIVPSSIYPIPTAGMFFCFNHLSVSSWSLNNNLLSIGLSTSLWS